MARTVLEPEVWIAMIVVDEPEPRVKLEPGARGWPDIM